MSAPVESTLRILRSMPQYRNDRREVWLQPFRPSMDQSLDKLNASGVAETMSSFENLLSGYGVISADFA